MNYEIVNLEEKIVAGVSAMANLKSPKSPAIIGKLWEDFYGGVFNSLKERTNEKCIGLYADYADNGDYKVMVCSEVNTKEQGAETAVIPAGRYAKFVIRGHIVSAVREFWQELWKTELDRAFVCDFEEYQGGDMNDMEIHMYISVK